MFSYALHTNSISTYCLFSVIDTVLYSQDTLAVSLRNLQSVAATSKMLYPILWNQTKQGWLKCATLSHIGTTNLNISDISALSNPFSHL